MKMKKKLLSVFLAFALAAGAVPALPSGFAGTAVSVSAALTTDDGFEYQIINDNKEIMITKYNGSAENVSVPAKINGKQVTGIDSAAFMGMNNIKSITLPEGLESVGWYAFYNCTSIKSITIPASVKYIADHAFGYGPSEKKLYDVELRCYYSTEGLSYAVSNGLNYTIIDPETVTETFQNFNNGAVADLNLFSNDHYWSGAQKGMYYVTNNSGVDLIFQSFETGEIRAVHNFSSESCSLDLVNILRKKYKINSGITVKELGKGTLFSSYCQGSTLYIGCKYEFKTPWKYYYIYVLYTYDINADKLLKTYYINDCIGSRDYYYSSLGADSTGRVFLVRRQFETETVTDETTGETSENLTSKYYVDMYDASMKYIASAEAGEQILHFGDFDTASGVFSLCVYYNYRSWGYDHDMFAVALGKAGSDSLEIKETIVRTIGQIHYSMLDHAFRHVGKYLCVDSPVSATTGYASGMNVYDISALYEDKKGSLKFNLNREYISDPDSISFVYDEGSKYARVCEVPGGKSDHIIAVEGSTKIAEYDPEAGEDREIGYITTDQPVYELFSDNEYLYIIMIDSEDFQKHYIKRMKWEYPTKITFSKSKLSVKVSDRKQLTAATDGTVIQPLEWSSSDPTVVSVSSSGVITAMKAGKAVITAKTKFGLKASCTVTVTDSALADVSGGFVKVLSSQKTDNANENDYSVRSKTMKSYIHENSDKTITRAEYYKDKIYIENYEADGKAPISTATILPELPIFGGIFFGKTYNFIVYGQQNTEQSDEAEVVRIVKYSKSWEKLGQASVKGANTYIPFDAGSLRMDETGGRLYIHTCHEMYEKGDGVHHQANMTFTVNESSMNVEQQQYVVYNNSTGYVSHSFNQFVKADGDRVYRLDHGDSHPRGLFLNYFIAGSDTTKIARRTIAHFGSYDSYYNFTGANVGGFEVMSHNAVAAYSSLDQSDLENSKQYNICLAIQDKDFKKEPSLIRLTDHSEGSNVTVYTPQMVKINDEILLVMWVEIENGRSVTKLVTVNEDGLLTSDIVTVNAGISDCQPIYCSDGLVRWYVTNRSTPKFYTVNPFYLSEYGSKLLGDVNADGDVNMKDITDLQRYVNGWDVVINEKNADLYEDGEINMKDITSLQRLINS